MRRTPEELQDTIDTLRELRALDQKKIQELELIAEAFNILVYHLAEKLPFECKVQKLAGVPLMECLKDFDIVPKSKVNHS